MDTITVDRRAERALARQAKGQRFAPADRTLHLVDADNLLADPVIKDQYVIAQALAGYGVAAGFKPTDHVVIATNHLHAVEIGLVWPRARLLPRSGVDGADYALIDEARQAAASKLYSRVVIGGGDHIYETVMGDLDAVGIDVAIVSLPSALARVLREKAAEIEAPIIELRYWT